ncbi:hypothetical protein OHU34_43155 [Streptomyces sp. NBC_00080]|uniref:hypothetical protein n=1 Tax=unclassified Streptomyces TaxID=2593676 RepID=UPI00114EA6E4|nr:hypothetical protein [Streptomyces sp. SLBN-115]TQJ37129.1 hypothetical protein FBY34_8639 [Streptomyces sp. SLBN-115]
MPISQPPAHKAEFASRARAEALAMAGADPDRAHRPPGALAAAALRAYSTLSAGTGRSVPVTVFAAGGDGVRELAAFLAVYAAEQERQERQSAQGVAAA